MNRKALFLILSFCLISTSAEAQQRKRSRQTPPKTSVTTQQTAVTKDGKTVILHSDGTWEYVKEGTLSPNISTPPSGRIATPPKSTKSYSFRSKKVAEGTAKKTIQLQDIDGDTIEGEIIGMVVQKIATTTSNDASGKPTYIAAYGLRNGSDATRIDEDGMHFNGGVAMMVLASQEGSQPQDGEVIVAYGQATPSSMEFNKPYLAYLPKGGTVQVKVVDAAANVTKNNILGTLGGTEINTLDPYLVIKTESGSVRLPVSQIVKFKSEE